MLFISPRNPFSDRFSGDVIRAKKFIKFFGEQFDTTVISLEKFNSKKKIKKIKLVTFKEENKFYPNSPYSASKASSDLIARSWYKTYKFPIIVSNCSNNYGKYQNSEKLIPLVIKKAINIKKIPVYGNGKNIRDWLHVEDHCNALYQLCTKGIHGQHYNIGGGTEISNIEIVKLICKFLDKTKPLKNKKYSSLITFVKDRKGHDFRYSVNYRKIKKQLNWEPRVNFYHGLENTILWYLKNH